MSGRRGESRDIGWRNERRRRQEAVANYHFEKRKKEEAEVPIQENKRDQTLNET